MKLTDFLDNVGRPIAYYPSMRKLTGSTTATILLCQFIYWRGKEADPDGWLYKTSEDIEKETGLSYNEQKTARRDLVEAGLLQEHYARLDHQMKFRLDINAINAKWGTLQGDIPESDKVTFGNDTSPFSLNSNTETTTETNPRLSIENAIATNQPVTHDMLKPEEHNAPREFERAFGFGELPWDSTQAWQKFKKFVVSVYQSTPRAFSEYVQWRDGDGKYRAFSNKKIRETPAAFMDTGWPEFLAVKIMRRTDEQRPEYKRYEPEQINAVPNPLRKPRL